MIFGKIDITLRITTITAMKIYARLSEEQNDDKSRHDMAYCPVCGQKLVQIRSVFHRSVTRHKCRRCKKYIDVIAEE